MIYICAGEASSRDAGDGSQRLEELVLEHAVIFVVCETNLDETFPNPQFHMDGIFLP